LLLSIWRIALLIVGTGNHGVDSLKGISSKLLVCLLCVTAGAAQETKLQPPSQAIAPAIASADSGLKPSGVGRRWSKWYRLGVGKAPRGYTVQKTEFWLSGDHDCGALAECREAAKSDQRVVWEFRLQGHDETGTPRRAYSEAHIRVTYRPQ